MTDSFEPHPCAWPNYANESESFIALWKEASAILQDAQIAPEEKMSLWRRLEDVAGTRPAAVKQQVEADLYECLRLPLEARAPVAERRLRQKFLSWLQAHATACIQIYFPNLAEVWVQAPGAPMLPGTMDVTGGNALWGGTSLYDFHFEYPVNGVGYPKNRIHIRRGERIVDVVTYCKEQNIRVFCTRCLSEITELSEPFSCRNGASRAEKVRQVLQADGVGYETPLPNGEDVPEGGVLLRMRGGQFLVLVLWRWRIILSNDHPRNELIADIRQEAEKCANRYGASELWLLGSPASNTFFRYGYRYHESEWRAVEQAEESVLGWSTFDASAQEVHRRAQETKQQADETRAKSSRQLGPASQLTRLATPPPLGELVWSQKMGDYEVPIHAKERTTGHTLLCVRLFDVIELVRDGLEVRLPGMRKAEIVWRAGQLTSAGRTYFSRMSASWIETWLFLQTHDAQLREFWEAGHADAQTYRKLFRNQEREAAHARMVLLRAQEAGLLTEAELASRLRGALAGRLHHPRVHRFRSLQMFLCSLRQQWVDPWLLAQYLDWNAWKA